MDRLSPSTLQVLLAVVALHRHGPVTARDIADALDWRSHAYVNVCLHKLQDAGLVDWEPRVHATIRPTCTVKLFALTPTEGE